MTKYDKVCKALLEKTRDTDNWITLTKQTDVRHKGKYAIRNLCTNQIGNISYNSLDEVIKEFELII